MSKPFKEIETLPVFSKFTYKSQKKKEKKKEDWIFLLGQTTKLIFFFCVCAFPFDLFQISVWY